MNPALVDVLDWVEELRDELRGNQRRTGYLDWAKCGTPANYRQHLRLGQIPCSDCLRAEARRSADAKAGRKLLQQGFARMVTAVNDDLRGKAWKAYG